MRDSMNAQKPATRRPRVLFVNSTLHIGGAEKVLANLATHLDRERFDVLACYLKQNGVVGEQMQASGVELLPIPGLRTDGKPDYFTSLKLLKLIRERQIDVIHTHDTHSFIDGAVCKLLRPRLKYVHTFHWGNYPVLPPGEERIERALWRVADKLVCVGHEQASAVRKLYGIPESRIRVIWNGTEPAPPEVSPELEGMLPDDGTPVICSVSTLIPQKGLEDLLRGLALVRDQGHRFLLLVAGEGVLRGSLTQLAQELHLQDRVRFLGWVQDASRRVLPAGDIFVQSSHWEAMSVVILEAMAAGKAIVATTVGENSRVIVNDVSGILVPPRNPVALAAGLTRVLGDPALRQRLGDSAQLRFREALTTRQMIQNHEDLYCGLLGLATGAE